MNGLKARYEIHVIQFTWGEAARLDQARTLFESNGLRYTSYTISRKPLVTLGTLWTLIQGRRFLRNYVTRHKIDILFPRTTFPAWMVSGMWNGLRNRKLVFDMDGFPLEERVDFLGLNPKGFQYRFLKRGERYMLAEAEVVLVRTKAAIEILAAEERLGSGAPALQRGADKYHIVVNGRDSAFFTPSSPEARRAIRESLGVKDAEILLVYSGSLGPQYCVPEMMTVFEGVSRREQGARLLILTGNPEYINGMNISPSLRERIIMKTAPFSEVPLYLGAADAGLAIRASSPSMKGVAPVKLGEYLMCGLPVIVSKGIGDTESFLSGQKAVYLLPDHGEIALKDSVAWVNRVVIDPSIAQEARQIGVKHFSLESSIRSYMEAFNYLQ